MQTLLKALDKENSVARIRAETRKCRQCSVTTWRKSCIAEFGSSPRQPSPFLIYNRRLFEASTLAINLGISTLLYTKSTALCREADQSISKVYSGRIHAVLRKALKNGILSLAI